MRCSCASLSPSTTSSFQQVQKLMKSSAWGSLRPITSADIRRLEARRTGGNEPFTHLVVLDFEWTADNIRPVRPISEITQFPSVLVSLTGRSSSIISEFDTFVRPTINPRLSDFAIRLTGIEQSCVDDAPTLQQVLPRYMSWLERNGLVDTAEAGNPIGRWSICTWSDADIASQLSAECRHKGIAVLPCFRSWVDLKVLYRRHYRREARGGLQNCVEKLGLTFEGRAHNGLIDSRNTAKIVLHMARGSDLYPAFIFRCATRGLDQDGYAYGSRSAVAARRQRNQGSKTKRALKKDPVEESKRPRIVLPQSTTNRINGVK